ncbi:MAG: GWxTD domain-containing protein [Candidatus Saccharicenans sp.]|uniref:GWxTD domain-containing protein n=1 Tax=Candidatus Saccharicenans sp. TaxID=2819258 RepID=UPI00404B2223
MPFEPRKINRRLVASLLGLLWLGLMLWPPAASPSSAGQKTKPPQKVSPRPQKKEKEPDLPDRYRKWLEEEVVYIITPVEKEIFLKLRTDRERDLFIEAFWKHRDPVPETEENEFRKEHYSRIEYANKYFGRESPKPGWKTDRGRFYIILGPPNDIQRIDSKSEVYDTEIWFYQGKTDMGLPPGFNVVFFRERGTGEYRLYSPTNDGPQAMLTGYWGDQSDYMAAYSKLREIDPNLASVSLSLIPGEENPYLGRPSLSSDLLLRQIELTPQRMVEDKYARKFFEYKDLVEVEYSANYLDSDYLVKVLKSPAGFYLIHYTLEPKRLSVNQYDNRYATNLKVNGTLSTLDGRIVYQFEKTYPVQMTEAQMRERQSLPVAIYDVIPCVPGEYKLSVLVKNEASKEFTSLEQTINIPGKGGVEMSAPLLAYRVTPAESSGGRVKAFLVGGNQLYLQAGRVFTAKDQLAVVLQIYGLTPELKDRASLRFQFIKETETFREKVIPMAGVSTLPELVEIFSLTDFLPAHYFLNVTLLVDGREQITTREEFDLTYLENLPRPWILSRVLPALDDPYYGYILGLQLYNLKRLTEARTILEQALTRAPQNEDLSRQLAQVYLEQEEFARAAAMVEPFIKGERPASYDTYLVAGRAYYQLGEFQKAIEVLDRAVNAYGTNIVLLNLIGDCYLEQGKKAEALAIWEKSLEIMPDQPELRQKIQAVRGK